jgi:PPK2 family polyphosphate:nucleotide phosphotransferase
MPKKAKHKTVDASVLRSLAREYRVTSGKNFRLHDFKPGDTHGLELKDQVDSLIKRSVAAMADHQEKLYAQDRWSLLLIFQALDAAGKDSAIKNVMSGLNPQGCEVYAFKAPSSEELDHDFLWRTSRVLPRRGHIGIFNRSYYEEVLVVRVHPNLLERQQLPPKLVTKQIWQDRYDDIKNFESYLTRQGTVIRKFFLHVSRDEQKRRFLKRLDEPEKNWKFAPNDVFERKYFDDYMHAYEDAIAATATATAPWYVVPADHKWFTRLVVASAVVETLHELSPTFPTIDAQRRRDLAASRAALLAEDKRGRK